jgi:hypothetical protein
VVSVWAALFMAAATQAAVEPFSAESYHALESEVVRDWRTLSLNRTPIPEVRKALRDKVRRLHATSPSFASLSMFAATGIADADENFGAEFAAMTRAMSRDFSHEPAPPAFQGLDFTNRDVRGGRAPSKSLFAGAVDVAGWSNSFAPLDAPLRSSSAGDVRHVTHFDGASLAVLAPVYELAKHLRRHVSVEFSQRAARDLDQDVPLHNVDSALMIAEFPAYAITRNGLIAGTFKSAGFFGGACASGQPTAAEFSFPKRIEDTTFGIFATGLRFDPARAKVRIDEQTWPDFEDQGGYTTHVLATRIIYTVDLDADGLPDLRGVSRTEREIDSELLMRQRSYPRPAEERGEIVPVAGWYAHDYNFLDANVGGRWLRLSSYYVVTCT